MHLIEWLVSAWPKRCLTATWTNLYLQGSGKVCEIHQKNVTTVAALYSRTDPAPPANNMTFLAAGGINDHNMQLYIPNIQYMSYLRPCPRVHSISLQQFFYSIYIYIEKLWKKNSEMMKIGGLCQTHIHLYPLSLQGCKTCLSGLRRSNCCWVPFFECWELCRSPYKPRLHRRCLTSALSWNEMRPPLQWKGFQP